MSTELGAFAVLSSLLLYLTDLIANHPHGQSKKMKWLEDIESKMKLKPKCQGATNGIRPTKFQLLQSRFMNSNREPYRKRPREVGKLIIKEKQPANRNGLNSIVSKLGRSSLTEISPKITPQEKAKCGKNTVKNILKKFLAAEEKEAKEKQPTPQKKAPGNNLPKIINRNFVMSKLKEKFEQSSNICSAVEVKVLLPCNGKKKNKKVLKSKTIYKAEIRGLQTDLWTASSIDSLEHQHLIYSTVPLPKFHVATEISHLLSWTAHVKYTIQPCDYSNGVRGMRDSQNTYDVLPDENGIPEGLAHGQQNGQLQNKLHEMPKVVTDRKDIVEMNTVPASPGSSLVSCPPSCENELLSESIPPAISKDSIGYKKSVISVASNTFSGSKDKNAGQVINEGNLSPTCDSSNSTEEGPSARHSQQDIKGGGIPSIPEGMFSAQETEIEFTELIKDHPFASQKCFPEQKALKNVPPFNTPVAQESCNTESPIDDQSSTIKPAAVDKMPPLNPSQRNGQDVQNKFYGIVQKREKLSENEETFSNHTVSTTEQKTKVKQKETSLGVNQSKIPDSQVESEQLSQKPQIHPLTSHQNSSSNTSIPNTNPVNQASTPNGSNADNAGNDVCYDFEKHHSSLSSDLVKHNFATTIDKAKVCSVNKMTNSDNSNEKSSLSQIDTSQLCLEKLITHEIHIPEQNPWPDSEKCHPLSLDHSSEPRGDLAEINRPWCNAEALQTPSSNEPTKNEISIQEEKVPSQNDDKHHSPPNKLLKPRGMSGSKNQASCNLASHKDSNKSENNATVGKNTKNQTLKYQPPSSREFRTPENNAAREVNPLCNMEKDVMPSEKETGKQEINLPEEKSEKRSLPSQSEMVMQQGHNDAAGRKDLQETVEQLIPTSTDRKEQGNERLGDKKWKEGGKKRVPYFKSHQKSIKGDFAKDVDDATDTKLSPSVETQHLPPSEHKEPIHSPSNLNYQMPPGESVKHECATIGDERTGKYQASYSKGPMTHKGKNGQNKLTNETTPSSGDREKSESKTRKKENSSNLRQTQFSFKKGLPQNTGRDWDALGDPKKDEIPSNEGKFKQLSPAAKQQQKQALNDSGNAKATAKDDKQTLWHSKNFQPPASDVKLETQQQQPQPSNNYVKPPAGVRDKKHTHPQSEEYSLPSPEALDLHKKYASGKKGSLSNFEKGMVSFLSYDSALQKEAECLSDTNPMHESSPSNQRSTQHSPGTGPSNQRSTQHSPGKYQIRSSDHVPGSETSEAQKCHASVGGKRKGRLIGLKKYIAESYSEGPLTLSFKPVVVRAIDTIKLDN